MKTPDQWFDEYGVTHQNPINKKIHWVCVPVITYTVIGMLWAAHPYLAAAFIVFTLAFYLNLSWQLAVGMVALLVPCVLILLNTSNVFWPCLAIFVVAWIGQFIGHHIEGAKPAFFDDLKFLLIGPLWLLGHLYKKYDIAY